MEARRELRGSDRVGNLESVRYGNGVTNLCQYDPRNRLTNLVWGLGASSARFAYQLGPTGVRAALAETFVAPPNSISRGYAWTYDRLYRLTQEVLSGATVGTLAYGLDPVGNRTNRVSTLGQLPTTSSSYTANDRLVGHGYDADGNTTIASGNSYQYDPLDRLTNVNNGAVLLAYDADGNRVRKTVGGSTTFYLVDDRNPSGYAQVLEEWTASGGTTNLSRVYSYGLALVSQREPGGTVYYFVTDGQGSTRVLINGAGTVVNLFAYDAYGTLIASSAPPQTAYLYTGQQWDPDLAMYYLRARYFDPQTGRFWTMDTYEGSQSDPLSLHKYLYAADNPVNRIDPSGNFSMPEISLSGLINTGMQAMRGPGLALAKRYAMRKIANVGVGAIVGGLYGGALDASGDGDFFGEGMLNGMKWGAIFGAVPKSAWSTDLGRAVLLAFAIKAIDAGVDACETDHTVQAILYFLGAGLSVRGAVNDPTPPSTLYKFIPAQSNIEAIKSQGLRVGAEQSVWATTMKPSSFSQSLIGGLRGKDAVTGQWLTKDFANGWVAIIRNTQGFKPSNTYWKAFTGQYEAEGTIPPSAFQIVPFSEATKGN